MRPGVRLCVLEGGGAKEWTNLEMEAVGMCCEQRPSTPCTASSILARSHPVYSVRIIEFRRTSHCTRTRTSRPPFFSVRTTATACNMNPGEAASPRMLD